MLPCGPVAVALGCPRRQAIEESNQGAGVGVQESGVRRQKAEDRSQESGVRMRNVFLSTVYCSLFTDSSHSSLLTHCFFPCSPLAHSRGPAVCGSCGVGNERGPRIYTTWRSRASSEPPEQMAEPVPVPLDGPIGSHSRTGGKSHERKTGHSCRAH